MKTGLLVLCLIGLAGCSNNAAPPHPARVLKARWVDTTIVGYHPREILVCDGSGRVTGTVESFDENEWYVSSSSSFAVNESYHTRYQAEDRLERYAIEFCEPEEKK